MPHYSIDQKYAIALNALTKCACPEAIAALGTLGVTPDMETVGKIIETLIDKVRVREIDPLWILERLEDMALLHYLSKDQWIQIAGILGRDRSWAEKEWAIHTVEQLL